MGPCLVETQISRIFKHTHIYTVHAYIHSVSGDSIFFNVSPALIVFFEFYVRVFLISYCYIFRDPVHIFHSVYLALVIRGCVPGKESAFSKMVGGHGTKYIHSRFPFCFSLVFGFLISDFWSFPLLLLICLGCSVVKKDGWSNTVEVMCI